MAPLFSKIDLKKLWHDVQNEETLICAKYGKDLFNISKVIGRKKVAVFLTHSVALLCMRVLVFATDAYRRPPARIFVNGGGGARYAHACVCQ